MTANRSDAEQGYGAFKFGWLKQIEKVDLRASELKALLVVFNRWSPDGARVSADHLAESTGMSLRSAKDALGKLQELGLIARVSRGGRSGDGRKWASVYQLGDLSTCSPSHLEEGGSTCNPSHVDPASKCSPLHVETGVKVQNFVSQSAIQRPQGATGCTPIDQLPIDQHPIDLSARVSNAREPAPAEPDRYAEWGHLLRRDIVIELEDFAKQIIAEDGLDEPVGDVVVQLIRLYSESTRRQSTAAISVWLRELHSITNADRRAIEAVTSTLVRRAS